MPFIFKANDNSQDGAQPPLTPNEKEVVNIINTAAADMGVAAMGANVQAAISTNDVERVVDALPWDANAATLSQTVSAFKRATTGSLGKGFPSVGFAGRFDYTDPRALEYAVKQSGTLVTNMTAQMQEMVRQIIGRAFTNNVPVYDTAAELRSVINLTARQEKTYSNFVEMNRTRLTQEGLSGRKLQLKLDALAKTQYNKMISQRSKVIARNEILVAENNGRMLGFQQSVEQGWSSPISMKRWSTSTDERTCTICMPMNGMSVQWNQYFPNGIYEPPAHIMCRCSISLLEPDSSLAQDFMPTGIL